MNLISLHTTYHSITSQCDSYTALYGALAKHSISRSIIGMLTFLQGISRPEISMEVYQRARYSRETMLSHERAVTRIGRHLLDAAGRDLT